jgi:hypothetical protein
MWLISGALFVGAKVALLRCNWSRLNGLQSRRDWATMLSFIALWPGMDVRAFIRQAVVQVPLITRGLLNLMGGAMLIWGIARLPNDPRWGAWVAMFGLGIALHGGVFTLFAAFWRSRGRDVKPLLDCPLMAASVTEFWSKRWNVAFRDLAHVLLFKPITKRWGARAASWSVFLASGFVHELVITVPARGGFGGPTAYFALQALGIWVERGCQCKRGNPIWRLRALAFLIVPLPLLFPPVFMERVAVPFFRFLHAL